MRANLIYSVLPLSIPEKEDINQGLIHRYWEYRSDMKKGLTFIDHCENTPWGVVAVGGVMREGADIVAALGQASGARIRWVTGECQ